MSDALIEEVRERADIVEICGEHVALKRSGRTYRGPCPLHGGEGPNFSVDPVRGIFKCFVCGEGGDVFSFLMKHLGLDFPSAVRHVAARVGVEIPEGRADREDPHADVREALAFAAEWFAERLWDEASGTAARACLRAREIDDEIAISFGLGYAPDAWRDLREAARDRGLSDEVLERAGLTIAREGGDAPYDRFRHRLTFTIRDLRDRPIGFGGRALGAPDERTPKYINSPDGPVFHKGEVLYGLERARHEIRREGWAFLAEGYTDVLALHAHGYATGVAPLGTALTPDQAKLLGRYARKVYLLYDSDAPGLRATFRAGDVLLAAGLHPLVVTLPAGEDPDSLLRGRGRDVLESLRADALDLLERKLQILERRGYLESIEGRRRALDGLLSTLRAVSDPALLDLYLGRAAERTGIRRETLVGEVARERSRSARGRTARRRGSAGSGPTTSRPAPPRGDEAAERALLLLLVRDPGYLSRAVELGIEAGSFRLDDHRHIFGALERAGPGRQVEELSAELEASAADRLRRLASDPTELVDPEGAFEEAVRRIAHREQIARLSQIDRELALAEEEQARALLVEKERIARELRATGVSLSFLRRYTELAAATGGNHPEPEVTDYGE
ncbi:MAG: DNA primase [Gemmatimonadota bacterium]